MRQLLNKLGQHQIIEFEALEGFGHIQKAIGGGWAIFFNSACIMVAKTPKTIEKKLISLGVDTKNYKTNKAQAPF